MAYDYYSSEYRWLGAILSIIGFLAILIRLTWKPRSYWLIGAAISASLFVVILGSLFLYDRWFGVPAGSAMIIFRPQVVFLLLSSFPIQMFGSHFMKMHLIIPSALLTWSAVGAVVGMGIAGFKRQKTK